MMMQRNILNKGFLQNFTALIIAVLLIVGASIMNLSRPESLYSASCSVFDGDQSSCETTSGCTWSGSCSIYNGDSNACQAASGSGCSYPGNTGDCSIFNDTSSCNAQYGCSASTYSCTWDSEFSTCSGGDPSCGSYSDEFSCTGEHFINCGGTYDTGECSGTLSPGICSGDFDDEAPTLVSAIADYETIVLTYNELLDESVNPSTGDYVLNVNNTQTGIDQVTVSGLTVILSSSQSVGAGSSISLHYTAGMSPIQDTSGNQAGNLVSQEVTNNTAYTLSGISPSSGNVINSITTNSDVEYTINRSALTSGTITITRTGGSIDNGSPHVCNMMAGALSAGTHYNFDFSDLSNGCQYAIGDLVDQAVYTFVFEGIDNQSNVVEPITITDVVFDNTAPAAPGSPDLDAQSDSGYSSIDDITNDVEPTFTINCENGATVTLHEIDSISMWGTGTCSGGTVSITSGQLSEGSHNLYARQVDSAGNVSEDSSNLLITIDSTEPLITSSIASTTTSTTATITWTTDGEVTSTVDYGITSGYGTASSSPTATTSHSYTLTDLAPSTLYHFRITVRDISDNLTTSDLTFTTEAIAPVVPTITAQSASSVGTSTATLNGTITSDGFASTTIRGFRYGTTVSYTATSSTSGTYGVGAFSQNITDLTCETTYHVQAFTENSAGTATSSDATFTTSTCPDVTAPVISSVSSGTPTTTGTTITWTTNEASTSTIAYGLTASYGTVATSSGTTSHSYILTGLTPNTTYHYQLTARDASLNVATTSDATFTTEAGTTPPPSTPTETTTSSGPTGGGGGYTPFYTTNTPLVVSPTGNTPTKVVPAIGTLPKAVFTNTNGTPYTFNKNLTPFTVISTDARILQVFLNSIGYTVSTTGAGSPGKENNRFGPATRAALARFQRTVGISPAVGYFGPITRSYINNLIRKLVGK